VARDVLAEATQRRAVVRGDGVADEHPDTGVLMRRAGERLLRGGGPTARPPCAGGLSQGGDRRVGRVGPGDLREGSMDRPRDVRDLWVARRSRGEARPARRAMKHSVDDQRVEMEVEVEGRAAAMNRDDRPAAERAIDVAGPLRGEDGAHERVDDRRFAARVVDEGVAVRRGQREHPVAHRQRRELAQQARAHRRRCAAAGAPRAAPPAGHAPRAAHRTDPVDHREAGETGPEDAGQARRDRGGRGQPGRVAGELVSATGEEVGEVELNGGHTPEFDHRALRVACEEPGPRVARRRAADTDVAHVVDA
jgi:hypothetical protein